MCIFLMGIGATDDPASTVHCGHLITTTPDGLADEPFIFTAAIAT